MKTNKCLRGITAFLFAVTTSFIALADPNPTLKEGKWRGVFSANEVDVPFNFELKKESNGETILTLINGSRRDHFHVNQTGDSLFVKMNTYDAALIAKVKPDGRLVGEYKSL